MSKIVDPARPGQPSPAPTSDRELALAALLVENANAQLAHARSRLHRALEQRARRPGRKQGVCGTPAGYRRHQRADEPACVACVEAHRWDVNVRALQTRRAS